MSDRMSISTKRPSAAHSTRASQHRLQPYGPIRSRYSPQLLLVFISIPLLFASTIDAALLQGCNFDEFLCDREAGEACMPDGLFGQCYSEAEADLLKPLILDEPLNELQSELLRLELTRLANSDLDWPDAKSQCVLAYFKLSIAYQLDYDTEFCAVRNPSNIWELIQRVQSALSTEDGTPTENAEGGNIEEDVAIPIVLLDENEQEGGGFQPSRQEELYEIVDPNQVSNDGDAVVFAEPKSEILAGGDEQDTNDAGDDLLLRRFLSRLQQNAEEKTDDKPLDDKLMDVLNDRPVGDLKSLSSDQLLQLVGFVEALQAAENAPEEVVSSAPEVMEALPLTSESNDAEKTKKDAEKFNSVDMGLANTAHKIVKGGIQRVEGNRVYMRVEPKANMTEEELYKLISYLDKKIALPNGLYFDEFLYENDQLSFRVSRLPIELPEELTGKKEKKDEHLESASGVAQAVYKRRKDIQTLSGVQVDETGIGSGIDVVPVERSDRDMLFLPILAICALTITSLLSVLAVHLYRNRKQGGSPFSKSYLPEVIDHLEGKAASVYEELCRHRSHEIPTAVKIGGSKHSSTSSWPDESLLQSSNLDISTGHVLLSFLQEFLDKPEEISNQWSSLDKYSNADATTSIASEAENMEKNFDPTILPYDESIVSLNNGESQYINASKIYDSDPRQVAYIATQSPMENTAADFWQMVWDQGVALIVNITDQEDLKKGRCLKYWPDEGSKAFGKFEIHLVSEHIWSEDYVVRSLYLKNTSTNETRTVTQFHYLTWPESGAPSSIKSLLEFRRKVNKSYRGRASPILVHCSDGAGRTGTYCLLDMVANRILKGVKELNIAGSLEHLRDQRMRMVQNEQQYKLVFSCVADEVNSLIKNMQH